MKPAIRVALILCALAAFGCGDDDDSQGGGSQAKCDQAYEILKACDSADEKPTSCNSQEEKLAQCVIDHPKGACDISDPDGDAFLSCSGISF